MKERKHWANGKKPSQSSGQFPPIFSRASRRLTPNRRKLKENVEYNSFLPNFRPSFVTVPCWMLDQLTKAREQKTAPQNYSVVSKRHAGRK